MTHIAGIVHDSKGQSLSSPVDRIPQDRRATFATLRHLRYLLFTVVLVAVATQLALHTNAANVMASALVLAGNLLGVGYALRQSTLRRYPISSLMLLGYTLSYFTMPPLGQLLELNSITHHLNHPVADFAYAISGMLALIGGHLLYSRIPLIGALRGILRKHFYGRLGFYVVPRLSQIWLMGAVGIMSSLDSTPNDQGGGASITQAVCNGLHPFFWVPYVILLLPAWSPLRHIPRWNYLGLVLYSVVLLILAMISNSRSTLVMGFASLLIVYFYLLATGQMRLPNVRFRNMLMATVAVLVLLVPVTNLAMTMVLVRGERTHLTPTQLIVKTWDMYRGSHLAQKYDQLMAAMSGGKGVNENYYDNLFLNRLANLKFVDNAVINQRELSPAAARFFSGIEEKKNISILPSPVIRFLGLDADKRLVTSGSSGDFLLYAAGDNASVIGGFRTGSLQVNLDIVFGEAWPVVLLFLSALIFAVVDAWCLTGPFGESGNWITLFNPLVIGMVFSQAFFFTSAAAGTDSIVGLMGVLMRGWIQVGLLYAVVFWASRIMTGGRRR